MMMDQAASVKIMAAVAVVAVLLKVVVVIVVLLKVLSSTHPPIHQLHRQTKHGNLFAKRRCGNPVASTPSPLPNNCLMFAWLDNASTKIICACVG